MTKTKTYEKLNSTGSCWRSIEDGTIYSYSTPLFKVFNTKIGIIAVLNHTFYSMTTRKHQNIVRDYRPLDDYFRIDKVLDVYHQGYGLQDIQTVLHNEIRNLSYELELLNEKKRLGKNQKQTKIELEKTISELKQLQTEV